MTLFIKLENGVPTGNPITEQNFRQAYPQISLPPLVTHADIEPHGFGIYDFSNQPPLDRYKKAVEVTPVKNDLGIWRQTWNVVEKTDAEKAEEDSRKAESVRFERNLKLQDSDWVISKATEQHAIDGLGIQIPQVWIDYRQALRDIPQQDDFPFNVIWPDEP